MGDNSYKFCNLQNSHWSTGDNSYKLCNLQTMQEYFPLDLPKRLETAKYKYKRLETAKDKQTRHKIQNNFTIFNFLNKVNLNF